MKKTLVSILTTVLLLAAIPAVFVLAAPGGIHVFDLEPTEEAEPTEAPEPTETPDEDDDGDGPEATPPALERVEAAKTLGIPPGRLLLIDRLAKNLGWTREQTQSAYGEASVKEIMKATNALRHSGKGHHAEVTPPPAPTDIPIPEP